MYIKKNEFPFDIVATVASATPQLTTSTGVINE